MLRLKVEKLFPVLPVHTLWTSNNQTSLLLYNTSLHSYLLFFLLCSPDTVVNKDPDHGDSEPILRLPGVLLYCLVRKQLRDIRDDHSGDVTVVGPPVAVWGKLMVLWGVLRCLMTLIRPWTLPGFLLLNIFLLKQMRSSLIRLRKMVDSHNTTVVKVTRRDGRGGDVITSSVSSKDLVPGDVIVLTAGCELSCDAALISGSFLLLATQSGRETLVGLSWLTACCRCCTRLASWRFYKVVRGKVFDDAATSGFILKTAAASIGSLGGQCCKAMFKASRLSFSVVLKVNRVCDGSGCQAARKRLIHKVPWASEHEAAERCLMVRGGGVCYKIWLANLARFS